MIRDARTANSVKEGDVFIVTVAFHVGGTTSHKSPLVRAYICQYPNPQLDFSGIPQGEKILPEEVDQLMKILVPVLYWCRCKADRD